MSELTTADRFELVEAQHYNSVKSEYVDATNTVTLGRWTNYGKDRLYINNLKTGDGWISLKDDDFGGDRWTKCKAEWDLEGDEITVKIGTSRRWTYIVTIKVHGDGFEAVAEPRDVDFDDLEACVSESPAPEIATDGGEPQTFTDAEILEQIEWHLDPESDDAPTVERVRELRAELRKSGQVVFAEWMDNIEQGHTEVVAEHDDKIVVSTGEVDTVDEDLQNVTDASDIERNILGTLEEQEAKRLSNYDWGYTYPRVLAKPDSFKAGHQFVEAVVNNLCKRGLSPGQAWAYYGVEIRDNSRNQWAKRCGYNDHSAVSEAVRKANRKLR